VTNWPESAKNRDPSLGTHVVDSLTRKPQSFQSYRVTAGVLRGGSYLFSIHYSAFSIQHFLSQSGSSVRQRMVLSARRVAEGVVPANGLDGVLASLPPPGRLAVSMVIAWPSKNSRLVLRFLL